MKHDIRSPQSRKRPITTTLEPNLDVVLAGPLMLTMPRWQGRSHSCKEICAILVTALFNIARFRTPDVFRGLIANKALIDV
jgi:hypothetical protein